MAEKEAQDKVSYLQKLKEKWGLRNLFQVVIVLIVFSLTGLTVVLLRPVVFSWFGFDGQTHFWVKAITYLFLIFPMYQILILVYGALLGQFAFFWEKEKKLFDMISRPFKSRNNQGTE